MREVCEAGVASHLTSRVDNLCCKVLPLVLDHLTESVLNRRVIALDEVSIYELDCE